VQKNAKEKLKNEVVKMGRAFSYMKGCRTRGTSYRRKHGERTVGLERET